MHEYRHDIAAFDASTRHLSRLERSVYRDMLERYYADGGAFSVADLPRVMRRCLVVAADEVAAFEAMLAEFFELAPGEDGGRWVHRRCEREMAALAAERARALDVERERREKAAERQRRSRARRAEVAAAAVVAAAAAGVTPVSHACHASVTLVSRDSHTSVTRDMSVTERDSRVTGKNHAETHENSEKVAKNDVSSNDVAQSARVDRAVSVRDDADCVENNNNEYIYNNNNIYNSSTPRARTKKSGSAIAVTRPDDVDDVTWAEWCLHRRKRRAVVTARVVDNVRREALACGLTLVEALRFCVDAGWTGFEAAWWRNRKASSRTAAPAPDAAAPWMRNGKFDPTAFVNAGRREVAARNAEREVRGVVVDA